MPFFKIFFRRLLRLCSIHVAADYEIEKPACLLAGSKIVLIPQTTHTETKILTDIATVDNGIVVIQIPSPGICRQILR